MSVILPRNAIKSTVATDATTDTVKRSTWIRCTKAGKIINRIRNTADLILQLHVFCTYDVRGAKFLLVAILLLLIALLNPFTCFLTFFECILSRPKTLADLDGTPSDWTLFSFVALQTLSGETKLLLFLKVGVKYCPRHNYKAVHFLYYNTNSFT